MARPITPRYFLIVFTYLIYIFLFDIYKRLLEFIDILETIFSLEIKLVKRYIMFY